MGMFDSLFVSCPKCATLNELQSKSGDCILGQYDLTTVPNDVLRNLIDIVHTCEECSESFKILNVCSDCPHKDHTSRFLRLISINSDEND